MVSYHPLREQPDSNTPPAGLPEQPVLEYQVLLFCESGEELTKPQLAELYGEFHLANEHLHKQAESHLRELLGGAR